VSYTLALTKKTEGKRQRAGGEEGAIKSVLLNLRLLKKILWIETGVKGF